MADDVASKLAPVLASGYIGQGSKVDELERVLQERTGLPVVTTNSCTSAIHLVLMLLGVGPGDEVITTPLTCIATNAPIVALGARPVWADVLPDTGNIDPLDVAHKVTKRTKAIIAVNWTGRPANYKALKAFGIPVIEDAAHGPELVHEDRGDFICMSFGPIKHLTTGDGGAVLTKDRDALPILRLLRWYGLDRTSKQDFRCEQDIKEAGLKLHMNDINATIGLANLPLLSSTVSQHRLNATRLWHAISAQHLHEIILPTLSVESNYWVFPLLTRSQYKRDKLKRYLEKNGVAASQVHARNDQHSAYDFPVGELPGLDHFDGRQLNIPCGWWLTGEDMKYIVKLLTEAEQELLRV